MQLDVHVQLGCDLSTVCKETELTNVSLSIISACSCPTLSETCMYT